MFGLYWHGIRRKYKLKLNRQSLDGSFTVEMAFIMPIVLYVIVTVLYLNFYLYDRNRISFIVRYELDQYVQQVRQEKGDTESISCLKQKLINELSQNLFFLKIEDIVMMEEGQFLSVSIRARSSVTSKSTNQLERILLYNPCSYIRKYTIKSQNRHAQKE